jgi:hypothetical protein
MKHINNQLYNIHKIGGRFQHCNVIFRPSDIQNISINVLAILGLVMDPLWSVQYLHIKLLHIIIVTYVI